MAAKATTLRQWRRLIEDNRFDDRVTQLWHEYDIVNYFPKAGKPVTVVITGEPPWDPMTQEALDSGIAIAEGNRPPGEDYLSRLRRVISILKQEFNLGPDFDDLLIRYLRRGEKTGAVGPKVITTNHKDGRPRVLIEVTSLTTLDDIRDLWPIVKKHLLRAFPAPARLRSTLDEKRQQFIVRGRKEDEWTFPKIASEWQKCSGEPLTAEAARKIYARARPKKSGH